MPRLPVILRLTILIAGLAGNATSAPVAADTLAEARRLIAESRLPEAREPLSALLEREPENLTARLLLAEVLGRIHRREEAIDLLKPALKNHPDNPAVLGAYGGQCLLQASDLGGGFRALVFARRGREAMEHAVALDPSRIDLREGLIEFYRQAPFIAGGDRDKARAHAAALTAIDPVRGAVWSASLLIDEKRYEEALSTCDAALATRPDDYVALYTLGRTVSECGLRMEAGEAALRRCLQRKPGMSEPAHAEVYYRLGLIAEKRGALSSARTAYQNSLAERPGFPSPAAALKRIGGPLTP